MVIFAYIGLAVFGFLLTAFVGTAFAAMRGAANPKFASPAFIGVGVIMFCLPSALIAAYLHQHGNISVALVIYGIFAIFGFVIGLKNKGNPPN